jgi:diacylglycerol kinase (ATP)
MNLSMRGVESIKQVFTNRNADITVASESVATTVHGCSVIIANGRYYANRMRIAPDAVPDDGLFDVVIVGNVTKSELLTIWPKLYSGTHVHHPKIVLRKAREIKVECGQSLSVEADGNIVGATPASFCVMPSKLTVVVP